jgi:LPXTG-site transpeptidase (sortase) family protein
MAKKRSDDQLKEEIAAAAVTGDFSNDQNAANIFREKVSRIYDEEPDADQEIDEAEQLTKRSKHQKFMYKLSTSGKDLATVQTEWHNYYSGLSANEKHQVWQEFYESQDKITGQADKVNKKPDPQDLASHKEKATNHSRKRPKTKISPLPKNDISALIKDKVTAGGKLEAKHHVQSLLFGLGMGFVVIFIFLFGFFNEIIIAPFIQPSRASASTPIIISSSGVAPTSTPEVIIPKINVQIPVDYSETSTSENVIENDLEDGVVHYPTTVLPGQDGNAAFFGHSSNNIFNPGKYKFAFVLLHTLVQGDTFYLTSNDKVYVYKVISTNIVSPNDVSVLNAVAGQTATATLITCDPPGTSINRLIVVGQQISPDPSTDTAPVITASSPQTSPTVLPGNGQTLWGRFISTLVGKVVVVLTLLAAAIYALKRLAKTFDL